MHKDELLIIRHGRSLNNIRKSEDMDCEITDWGHKQAENVGHFLANHMNMSDFSFYTSPFLRCLQTAAHIRSFLPERPFYVDQGAREYINHSGRQAFVLNRKSDFPDFVWGDYPEDGVTYSDEWNEQFLNRMHDFFLRLPPKSVVVSHGLPVMLLMHIAQNPATNTIPIWDHSIDNCSMTYIVNGRLAWHGRNLYHERDEDPFQKRRPYDSSDLLKK